MVGLNLAKLAPVLRAHFKEKDATAVFSELSSASQQGNEGELDFCMRLMGLRDKVMILTKEEKGQYTGPLVQNQFQKSMFTGLKNESVRQELKPILRRKDVPDHDLLAEISEVVMSEQEHQTKVGSKKGCVSAVTSAECKQIQKKDKSNPLLDEIQKLTAKVSEISNIKTEVENLRKEVREGQQKQQQCQQLSATAPAFQSQNLDFQRTGGFGPGEYRVGFRGGYGGRGGYSNRGRAGWNNYWGARRGPQLCEACKKANAIACNHCFLCSAVDHRCQNCPLLKELITAKTWNIIYG